jgi:hypothetical protein
LAKAVSELVASVLPRRQFGRVVVQNLNEGFAPPFVGLVSV